ncbi:hypothetical protein B0J11DRAFT_41871 [Dendryphion nanum]|uniref:F-box domain-containing protein n=1 Tax=Dendryphion nanum TaxID=256645 RepID=A0A9P9EGZ0_9PLEO|nr:hypothetical protein B0J11DRAFT_41871 [Dendryphion nanum]
MEPFFPSNMFKRLPREVYDCILKHLEQTHLEDNESCRSCYLKDLHSLSLTSRSWDRAATLQLYQKALVLTNEDHPKMPKVKVKGSSRLKLLRRTLRERQVLAKCVRELHLSDIYDLYQNATIEREEIVNQVASLVLACPNLERIVGFHLPFTHSFDRLSHALSTRRKLKERVWLLSEKTGFEPDEEEDDSPYYNPANDPTERFLELNSNHSSLNTLVIHQQQSRPTVPLTFRAIIGTIRQLPLLRNLSLSGLPASSFTNLALNALPLNLQSLRLENLPGINDKGLLRLSTSQILVSLRSLTLINLEIANLSIIANILSPHLYHLKHFTLAQHKAPFLSPDAEITYLHSHALTSIHWEIRSQASPVPTLHDPTPTPQFPFPNSEPLPCLATSLLATSIKNDFIPSLRRLRAPHDPQGILQNLCKPLATALLPSDISYLNSLSTKSALDTHNIPTSFMASEYASTYIHRADSAMSSPLISEFPSTYTRPPRFHRSSASISSSFSTSSTSTTSPSAIPPTSSLSTRLAAQARILAARKHPCVLVHVTDPNGALRVGKPIGGFRGNVGSGIIYGVVADGGKVEGGGSEWVVGIGDVVGELRGDGFGMGVGKGSWCRHGVVRDKRGEGVGLGRRESVSVGALFRMELG